MGSGPVAGAAQDTSPRAPPRGRRPRPSVLLRAPPCSPGLQRALALEPLFWCGTHVIICWFAFQAAKHFYLVQVNFYEKVYIYIFFFGKGIF